MNQLVAELGTSFDQLVCTGFLHHFPDSDEGLESLRGVLKVDGAMHLMWISAQKRSGRSRWLIRC